MIEPIAEVHVPSGAPLLMSTSRKVRFVADPVMGEVTLVSSTEPAKRFLL